MARNRTKRETLLKQIENNLTSKLAIGQSKKADKAQYIIDDLGNKTLAKEDETKNKIYSWSTFKTYLKHTNYFAQWCRETYNCKTLNQCKPYINEYLQKLIDENKSAYTIKMTACAIGKLYGCSSKNFIETPKRQRRNITRSRLTTEREKHFSIKNNAELINFCQCTGLRRAELSQLRGTDLIEKDGQYYLRVHTATKGGRERFSEIVGTDEEIKAVVDRMKAVKSDKVFDKISTNADIHSYRSDYAVRVYNKYKRDLKTITDRKELYCCRGDLTGVWYDRNAMLITSRNLGHNRVDVIAGHYLR